MAKYTYVSEEEKVDNDNRAIEKTEQVENKHQFTLASLKSEIESCDSRIATLTKKKAELKQEIIDVKAALKI